MRLFPLRSASFGQGDQREQEPRRAISLDVSASLRWKRVRSAAAKRAYSESELASAELMLRKLKRGDDVRERKVSEVRGALAAGQYGEDAKLEWAAERMLDEVME